MTVAAFDLSLTSTGYARAEVDRIPGAPSLPFGIKTEAIRRALGA